MQGLKGKYKVWTENTRFGWKIVDLNGKYKVWMEIQGLNGNTRFEWKMQGLDGC